MKNVKSYTHYQDFIDAHEQESDRGYVLVAQAILDDALEYRLRRRMRQPMAIVKRSINPLFTHSGPLGSFWAKVQLSYAMRIIPDWLYKDLEILRQVRNDLAHTFRTFSFGDKEVESRMRQLRSPYRVTGNNHRYASEERLKKEMARVFGSSNFAEAKVRFAMTFHYIHGFLTEGRAYAKRKALPSKSSLNGGK